MTRTCCLLTWRTGNVCVLSFYKLGLLLVLQERVLSYVVTTWLSWQILIWSLKCMSIWGFFVLMFYLSIPLSVCLHELWFMGPLHLFSNQLCIYPWPCLAKTLYRFVIDHHQINVLAVLLKGCKGFDLGRFVRFFLLKLQLFELGDVKIEVVRQIALNQERVVVEGIVGSWRLVRLMGLIGCCSALQQASNAIHLGHSNLVFSIIRRTIIFSNLRRQLKR